jgi:dTDP-4-dehydrorhamnose reductase
MMSGGAVVASDIAVHHEIYLDAAQFCNPYSVTELAKTITDVIDPVQKLRRNERPSRFTSGSSLFNTMPLM